MVTFEVMDGAGARRRIEVPHDINLSLMEVLRASDYPILATCGGLALCATCCVEVVTGCDRLRPPSDAELDMLDTLPSVSSQSRLACQIRIDERLQDAVLRLKALES